jgi:serine phosphatase RsbU (regulator of sigma subunit)
MSHTANPAALSEVANRALAPMGAQAGILVVDHEQRLLRRLPEPTKPSPPPSPIDASPGGRAFTTVTVQSSPTDGNRLWLPVLDGTERLGVLDLSLPSHVSCEDPAVRRGAQAFAGLIGHLLQAKSGLGDSIEIARRTAPMSVASELLLRLVPSTTFASDDLVLSAVLEPTYDIGGDAFDYSVDTSVATISIFDALGHGLPACLTSAVTVSAIRAARRAGERRLAALASVADRAIQTQWNDLRFATAVLAELDLDTGQLGYVNAGHPPPLVLRGGRVVEQLDQGRRMPLGLEDTVEQQGRLRLERGDRVLFFTDGVVEARDEAGVLFGLTRLVEVTEQHAGHLPTAEVLRLLSHRVMEHQDGPLADDATMLLAEWAPDETRKNWP